MGEFTTRTRFSNPVQGLVAGSKVSSFRNAEYTYSWRSRVSPEDLGDSSTGYNVGIRPPISKGNLSDILADRKRFAEEIGRTMGGSGSNTIPEQLPVCSTTDIGHPFTSLKFNSISEGRYTSGYVTDRKATYDYPVFATQSPYISDVAAPPRAVFPTAALPTGFKAPDVLERNARLNPVFFEMLPTKQVAQVGETVIALLRGEVPAILGNIRKFIAEGRRRFDPKHVGSEYLNQVFGWQPLISEIQSVIKTLMIIDHMIYGEAWRRQRQIAWPSVGRSTLSVLSTSSAYLTQPDAGVPMSRISLPTSAPSGKSSEWYLDEWKSYDIRLSARLVPIARPTLLGNRYVDQAVEQLEKLGFWYPSLGWDLLPYSWLIDWVTSLGASINNATKYGSSPGQVNIDYAWATSQLSVLSTARPVQEGWTQDRLLVSKTSGTAKSLSVSKTRFSATPFGFGLDLSGLKAGQIAILVALGLAKSRR